MIRNLTGNEHCRHCEPGLHGPSGLAVTASRPRPDGTEAMDEYGPCPACEAGARAEIRGWAGEFWQGRDAIVRPLQGHGETPLSHAENLARLRLLMRRFGGEHVDPCVGVDIRDSGQRMRLLNAEATRS